MEAIITEFPPRPIADERELIATQTRINSILDKGQLTQDDRDYLRVLGMLVYDYEEQYEPLLTLQEYERLSAMTEEDLLES